MMRRAAVVVVGEGAADCISGVVWTCGGVRVEESRRKK